ncbi:MAG TPA: chemotaxis protein CheB [Bryobacteraceae bacterium]
MDRRPYLDDFAVVMIGASGGGVEAIAQLFSQLPSDIPAAIFVTLHVGSNGSILPDIIRQRGFPAGHARQGNRIFAGNALVAPPDHHLLVRKGSVALSRGPRENWARPAIDPMFRSAANAYGARVIGVILTGNLNDGTLGLQAIKRRGGLAIVQDPEDATCPSMPASALAAVAIDQCVPMSQMPEVLCRAVLDVAAPGRKSLMVESGGPRHG